MGDARHDEPIIGPGSQNQRRTLWIMAAAGIFLLVVIGAAVVLYSPAVNKEKGDNSYVSEYNPDNGWNEDGIEQFSDASLSDGSSVSDIPDSPFEPSLDAANDASSDVYSFDLDDMKSFDSSAIASSTPSDPLLADSVFASDAEAAGANEPTTIDLNKISSSSSSSSVSAKNDFTAAQIESAKTSSSTGSSSSSTKSSSSSSSSKSSSASSSAKSSSSSSAASSKTSSSYSSSTSLKHAYWVQVGSFSDKSKADAARTDLEKKGYRNVSNSTTKENMYRVRIGPYSDKSEAESVVTKVSKYKEYENAFISDANAPLQK